MEETKFNEIAGKIMRHSNYGKRNPMDIGLEYGYKKEELEKFICCLKEKRMTLNRNMYTWFWKINYVK